MNLPIATKDLARHLAVYLVADPAHTRRDLITDVEQALAGGATCVQLRAKQMIDREALRFAHALCERCHVAGALFLVNDRLDLALAANADGIHLGVDDLPIRDARRLAGNDFIVGYSPESDEQAAAAASNGANYLGIGPVFGTASKDDAGNAIGLQTLHRRAQTAGIPIIGIGGITAANAASAIEAGAVGIAVIGAILRSDDPRHATAQLRFAVDSALGRLSG
jgi:thiamine-phosphate pyrophosphorylase